MEDCQWPNSTGVLFVDVAIRLLFSIKIQKQWVGNGAKSSELLACVSVCYFAVSVIFRFALHQRTAVAKFHCGTAIFEIPTFSFPTILSPHVIMWYEVANQMATFWKKPANSQALRALFKIASRGKGSSISKQSKGMTTKAGLKQYPPGIGPTMGK